MIIKNENGTMKVIDNGIRKAGYAENGYISAKGENNGNYVILDSVTSNILNVSEGNSKTGNAINFNLPIEYTCNHCCECYKNKVCYAENGCYSFSDNQAKYSENLRFFNSNSDEKFIQALQLAIDEIGYSLFRYFTCGDIPNSRFFRIMVKLAILNPEIKFWSYTKKYNIVNSWIDENGKLPENLTIVFSHWLNNDGTYFPMDNKYNLPVSEFIPFGKEHLKETVTHICPCSDPTKKATCETCDYPCYNLKSGESMALLEHSTKATKERDKAIKQAKERL